MRVDHFPPSWEGLIIARVRVDLPPPSWEGLIIARMRVDLPPPSWEGFINVFIRDDFLTLKTPGYSWVSTDEFLTHDRKEIFPSTAMHSEIISLRLLTMMNTLCENYMMEYVPKCFSIRCDSVVFLNSSEAVFPSRRTSIFDDWMISRKKRFTSVVEMTLRSWRSECMISFFDEFDLWSDLPGKKTIRWSIRTCYFGLLR